MPSVTASVRLDAWSFAMIEPTWNFTVCAETPSFFAIDLFGNPAASIESTSISRGVSTAPSIPPRTAAGCSSASGCMTTSPATTARMAASTSATPARRGSDAHAP